MKVFPSLGNCHASSAHSALHDNTLHNIPFPLLTHVSSIFIYCLSFLFPLTQECSRERPRGYPFPLVPLIAVYDDAGIDMYDRDKSKRRRRRRGRTQEDREGYLTQSYSPGRGDGLLEPPGLLPMPPLPSHVYNGDWGSRGIMESRRLYNTGDQAQHFDSPPLPPPPPPPLPPPPSPPPPPLPSRTPDQYSDFTPSSRALDLHRRTQSEPVYQGPYNPPHSRHAYTDDFPRTPLPPRPPRHTEHFPRTPLPPKHARRDYSPPPQPPPSKHMRRSSETVLSQSWHRGIDAHEEVSSNRRRSGGFERGFHPSPRALSAMERHSNNNPHRRYSYGNR